jgi:hypothetical protein
MLDPQLTEDAPVVNNRTLRQFAGLCVLFLGGLAAWQWLARENGGRAGILAAVAIGLGALGFAKPEAIRPLFVGLMTLTWPIGRVVSSLLLVLLFYVVFAPVGLFFRIIGRDVLGLRRPNRASYWTAKPRVTDVRSYLRQS